MIYICIKKITQNNQANKWQTEHQAGLDCLQFACEKAGIPFSQIIQKNYEKPQFKNTVFDFNISHSHKLAVACISTNESEKIGCDIEYIKKNKNYDLIKKKILSVNEQNQLFKQDTQTKKTRLFYIFWVLKEAWIKMHGLTIANIKQSPEFLIFPQKKIKPKNCFFLYTITHTDTQKLLKEKYVFALSLSTPHVPKDLYFLHDKNIIKKQCFMSLLT